MVKNLLTLLSARQNSILSGALVLMLTITASKFLGLIRDRMLSATFTPDNTAIFLASFRIPDLVFQLLIFGALSVAFIPVFTDFLHQKNKNEAFKLAADVFNVFIFSFCLISLLIAFWAVPLTGLVVPGFSESQKLTTAHLTQIMLIGQVLLAIGSFFTGISQSFQRFVIPALAGVFYNVGVILGIIFLAPRIGVYGPAIGVIGGAFLHVLIQVPLIKSLGFRYKFNFRPKSQGVLEIFKLMGVRTLGLAVEQINETVGLILASIVSTASVTYLTFAQHLQTVPISLFGVTIAQAALPVLSQEQSKGEMESFRLTLLTTIHQILFLTLPATAILIILRIPAVRLVFGAAQFNWEATVLTGRTVAFLAVGLVTQALSLLLVRAFYALKDTKTPVIVSLFSVTLNIILSVVFVKVIHLEVWSLGVASAVSSNLSLFLLIGYLEKKIGNFADSKLFLPGIKMLLATVISAVFLYIPVKYLDQLVFDTTRTFNLIILTGIASLFGLAIYLLLVWLFKVQELETFGNLIKKVYEVQLQVKTEELVAENKPV